MRNNTYPFPQGVERQAMKKSITTAKRKQTLEKAGRIVMIGFRWLWFAFRITLANMLHMALLTKLNY